MGWTDDEIDDFFREASGSQKVDYNDAYWKKMESLLDSEKTVKRRFFWWFFSAVIVILMLGTGYHFFNQNETTTGKEIVFAQTKEYDGSEKSILTEVHARGESITVLNENGVQKYSGKSDKKVKSDKISVIKPGETYILNNEKKAVVYNTDTPLIDSPGDKRQDIVDIYEKKGVKEYLNEHVSESDLLNTSDLSNVHEEENGKVTPETQSVLTYGSEEPLLRKKTGYYVAAGAGAGTAYVQNTNDLLVQWRVRAGIEYTIADQFRLGAGLGFRQQITDNLEIERSREYYSLGLIYINQTISYDRLQFLDLNVHAHYLFRKLAVGFELTPSYLISSRASMSQTQEENGQLVDGDVSVSPEKQFVRSDNFNLFGFDAGLSLQYEFKRKVYLELGAGARFNQLLKSSDFKGGYSKFPVRLELGVIKRF